MNSIVFWQEAARVIAEAGGHLVGRTRLQKVAYLTQLAGFGGSFDFEYHNYGPYSEDLARGIEVARDLGIVTEEEKPTDWGGKYSVFKVTEKARAPENADRSKFISKAAEKGAIELELAATAAFLYVKENYTPDGKGDPWAETARRKPEKATPERLRRAKLIYSDLLNLGLETELPPIV